MTTTTPPDYGRPLTAAVLTLALAILLLPVRLSAQDYTYGGTVASNLYWSNPANWNNSPPAGGPSGTGIYVRAVRNISGSYIINLHNASDGGIAIKTVGQLEFGDTNGTNRYEINEGTGVGILRFDGGASNAILNTLNGNNDQINVGIQLATSLDISYLASAGVLTFSKGISGLADADDDPLLLSAKAGTVRFTAAISDGANGGKVGVLVNGGRMEMNASSSSYTGTTVVRSGTLTASFHVNSGVNSGFGNSTSAIELGDSLTESANTAILMTGGFNMARDINVNSNTGLSTIGTTAASNGTAYTGSILLNKDVRLLAQNGWKLSFTKSIANSTGEDNIVTVASSSSGNGIVELRNTTLTNQFAPHAFDVASGILQLGASNQIANSTDLSVSGGIFNIQNFSDTVDEVVLNSGSITGTSGVLTATTFELKEGTVSAKLAGEDATLAKTGAGTVILSSISTYTGATTVSDGVLVIGEGGSIASSSLVTVSGSGVLGGTGTVGAVQLTGGGTLAAGLSPGILNTGDLDVGEGSHLAFELGKVGLLPEAGVDYDQVNVTGGVTFTGADLALTLGDGIADGDVFYILANDGADLVNGIFASLNGGVTLLGQDAIFLVGGRYFQISYSASWTGEESSSEFSGAGNDIALMAVPVPESSVAAFVLVCLAGGALSRRRRRNT